MKDFSNFIVNHPENMIIDKSTFKNNKSLNTSDTVITEIPMTLEKKLILSPIRHDILKTNQLFKEKKNNIITKEKNKSIILKDDNDHLTVKENKWLGQYYTYKSDDKNNLSL